jgi:hypothetical protein
MKKIFFTAAIVFTTSILTILVTENTTKTASVKIAGLVTSDRNILATAD